MEKIFLILLVLCLASCCFGTDWYVSQDGAGSKDGTTYNNRWDGLLNVVWGGGGVVAGDNLYICGLHVYSYTGGAIVGVADIFPVSGTDDDTRVTIRGDYPSDEGIIWQAYILQNIAWTDKGSNVWQNKIPGGSRAFYWFEDITANSWTLMEKVSTSATLTGTWTFTNDSPTVTAAADGNAQAEVTAGDFVDRETPSIFFEVQSVDNDNQLTLTSNFTGETGADAADAASFSDISAGITALAGATTASYFFPEGLSANDDIYVSCADDADPTGRISGNRYGYDFRLNGLEYITFLNLNIYAPYRWLWEGNSAEHIRYEGCTLKYGEHSLITAHDGTHYLEVINCDLSTAKNAIYTISGSAPETAPSHYIFQGNTIHDIGVLSYNQNSDAHSIGIQGGTDGWIDSNYIYNCGTGPLIYAWGTQDLTNTIVSRNLVKDLHILGSATGYGISTMTDNPRTGDTSGIEFSHNIVMNSPAGGRHMMITQVTKFYNNIFYKNANGFLSTVNVGGVGGNVELKNNIFLYSTSRHIRWATGATTYTIDSDYNVFLPTGGVDYFQIASTPKTYAEWQAFEKAGSTFDTNSLDSDPKLIGPSRGKFAPMVGSIVIGAGVTPIGSTDYRGNPVGTDIGAITYIQYGGF